MCTFMDNVFVQWLVLVHLKKETISEMPWGFVLWRLEINKYET
jgi:hypothetical protein